MGYVDRQGYRHLACTHTLGPHGMDDVCASTIQLRRKLTWCLRIAVFSMIWLLSMSAFNCFEISMFRIFGCAHTIPNTVTFVTGRAPVWLGTESGATFGSRHTNEIRWRQWFSLRACTLYDFSCPERAFPALTKLMLVIIVNNLSYRH